MNKCPFCRSSNTFLLFPANNHHQEKTVSNFACTNIAFGLHGPINKCRRCGMIYVGEKLSQEKISSFYQISEDPTYLAQQPAREKTFNGYLSQMEAIIPRKGKLLDIGTNTGLFVKLARDRGWQAQGLEPNKEAAAFAKANYGLNLINKPFGSKTFPGNSYDVVTMWDVIEHFTDPIAEMKKVFQILRPGGVFIFSTVDPEAPLAKLMGTRWSWYMEMHRVFLSMAASRGYLAKAGFEKIIFRPHFRYLSLGYFATRLRALNTTLAALTGFIAGRASLTRVLIPYYANDLYNCYAIKPAEKS